MMWLASLLRGYGIEATDGSIGSVDDSLFDDRTWTVRWLVVDTGNWLSGRLVLLPSSCLGHPDAGPRRIPVPLTRQKVKDSPGLDSDAPVSRQMEDRLYGYYGWDPYWAGGLGYPRVNFPGYGGGPVAHPGYDAGLDVGAVPASVAGEVRMRQLQDGDPHLRSTGYVTGFAIGAIDGEIGHVEDFLIEDESWVIRYLIVDTVNWWPGKKVLIAPDWIKDISWAEEQVAIDLTRQKIKDSPRYQPSARPKRSYEERLYGH